MCTGVGWGIGILVSSRWVPNCDTLHALVKEYRESRNVLLNVEHRYIVQMAPDYEKLPLLNKGMILYFDFFFGVLRDLMVRLLI